MESKKMMKKELAFMKKKGAPKSMIKHEKAEAKGMNKGGKTSCYAAGGPVRRPPPGDKYAAARNDFRAGEMEAQKEADFIAANAPMPRGAGRGPMSRNGMMPKTKMYAKGGMVKADGCATKGKTKGRFI